MCDYPTKNNKASETKQWKVFLEWQLFGLFCISHSTNQMKMVHSLNNHFENSKTNSIEGNVKIEQQIELFFLVFEKQDFLARFAPYVHTTKFHIEK